MMASSVDTLEDSKSVCLILLIGVPGSGKTFLTKFLVDSFDYVTNCQADGSIYFNKPVVVPVTFDDIIDEFDYTDNWKGKRKIVSDSIEGLIRDFKGIQCTSKCVTETKHELIPGSCNLSDKNNLFIIIDDNMYYRSMRYEYYRIAKTYGTGFCQIYIETTLEKALEVNGRRSNVVSDSVIKRMFFRIEPPNPDLHSWECNSVNIQSYVDLNERSILNKLSNVILSAVSSPEELSVVNEEFSIISKEVNEKSIPHQIDLKLRKLISNYIKDFKLCNPNKVINVTAQNLNLKRAHIIRDLKSGGCILPSELIMHLQNYNRTVDVNNEINDILSNLLLSD